MNKRSISLVGAVLIGLAWGQGAALESQAVDLLNQARAALGGEGLSNLKTYRERSKFTVLDPSGKVQGELIQLSLYDFVGGRIRVETYQGEVLLSITQVTPQGGQSWTQQSGTLRLPAPQTGEVRADLFRGWAGLRFGGSGRELAAVTGPQTYQQAQGTEVRVRTQGVETRYLLDPRGVLLGEKTASSELGELTVLYQDYRPVSGIQVPFRAQLFAGGRLFAQSETLEATVNPILDEAAFKMP